MTNARANGLSALRFEDGQAQEFRRFVCWEPSRVAKVMDTEALQTSPEVFLATHSPLPMFRADLSGGDALREYHESAFLRDFLATEDYSFVAVLGGAGTGKSHLIRWLSTRIQATEQRRVLLIPRAGTSLHEVLRHILDGMQGERFDEYRRRLRESSASMSIVEARTRLLDNLAVAVGMTARGGETSPTGEEDYLASELPNLLRDPVFRSHFLQAGGVLDRLATHVVGGGGVERVEERRTFGVADLPSRFQDVKKASVPAQEIYRNLIANEDLRQTAARWLTRHLDEAVTQLMRLSGTDLLQLMVDVRVELAQRDVELVLLIEDLATLQGIDQQLLEALIIRPRQPNMPALCALRTAVAMTSGYYEGLRKNVHQRFDFRVVMGTRDTRGRASAQDLERFTARYLNAARLDVSELQDWYARSSDLDAEAEPVPSACRNCAFREPCHRAFGAQDGMGLYPFSPVAVDGTATRVSPDGFNPRTQLKEGYKPVLENHATALAEGLFPPPELIERLGGFRLRPIIVTELRRLDPANHARRATLLDLWANAREVGNLDPVVHRAFDLPLLGEVSTFEPTVDESRDGAGPTTVSVPRPSSTSPAVTRLDEQLRALDEWSNGASMSQDLMQDLREVVYAAVVAHIDWNALHLIPGEFTGAKGFRQRYSINFTKQILAAARAQIQLPLPLREEDLAEVALALQGLLRFKAQRSWKFDDGGKYYRAFLRQVEAWSQHVLSQVDSLRESGESWDPVPAATELLAIGARVLGRPRSRDPERTDLLDAIFADAPDRDESERSDSWQRLARVVRRSHGKLQEIVRARVACSKGDSRRIQMIDAGRLLPVIAEIRRTLRPTQPIPTDLERTWRVPLQEYRDELVGLLEQAVADERVNQLARYDVAARQLGAEGEPPESAAVKRRLAIAALRRALDASVNAGVLAGVQKEGFEEKLTEFEGIQFQAWAESIERIRAEEDFGRLLMELSLVPTSASRVTAEFLELAGRMLERTEAAVRSDVREHEREGTEELERVQDAIRGGLASLESDLSTLVGSKEQ